MRLGDKQRFSRCTHCKIVIANKKHEKCFRCYNETKTKKSKTPNISTEYFTSTKEQSQHKIKHKGYIDAKKQEGVIRIFYTNPNGFGPDNFEKIQMLLQSKDRLSLDGVFFSSPDRQWNS